MERILNINEVAEQVGLSKRTIYDEISEGRFPRPLQLTARRVGWPATKIDAWIKSKVDVGASA